MKYEKQIILLLKALRKIDRYEEFININNHFPIKFVNTTELRAILLTLMVCGHCCFEKLWGFCAVTAEGYEFDLCYSDLVIFIELSCDV